MKKKGFVLSMTMAFVVLIVSSGIAATLQWDPVPHATGYKLYYGKAAGSYTQSVNVGNVIHYDLDTLPLTQGITYYFAVTAYNAAGESSSSAPVSWTPPDTVPPAPPKWTPTNPVTSP